MNSEHEQENKGRWFYKNLTILLDIGKINK